MRDYSLLEDIYLGDIEKIEKNKDKLDVTLSECVVALRCYSSSPDQLNFDIAKIIIDKYTENHNSKEEINDLVDFAKQGTGHMEKCLEKMSDNPYIANFLSENGFKTNDFIDFDLRLDKITNKDREKINSLIEITTFKQILEDHVSLEKAEEIINLATQSATVIISKNQNNSDGYSPLAIFLAEDVVETLVSNAAERHTIDTNIWDGVERYDLNSIKNADLEEMSEWQGPQHLEKEVKGKVYEASWVLLKSGDLKFASTYFAYGNHRPACHTDLANGEPVVSAGMAYFSEDKKTLLAIDNKTGHYRTSLDSVLQTLPVFEKSDLNIDITIVSEFGWGEPKPFKKNQMDIINENIEKMRKKSFPQLNQEYNNISKTPKPPGS